MVASRSLTHARDRFSGRARTLALCLAALAFSLVVALAAPAPAFAETFIGGVNDDPLKIVYDSSKCTVKVQRLSSDGSSKSYKNQYYSEDVGNCSMVALRFEYDKTIYTYATPYGVLESDTIRPLNSSAGTYSVGKTGDTLTITWSGVQVVEGVSFDLSLTYSYVSGAESFTRGYSITPHGAEFKNVKLAYGGDAYFSGSDKGTSHAVWEPAAKMVYLKSVDSEGTVRAGTMSLSSNTATRYFAGNFSEGRRWAVGFKEGCSANATKVDNGYYLQWHIGNLGNNQNYSTTAVETITASAGKVVLFSPDVSPALSGAAVDQAITLGFVAVNMSNSEVNLSVSNPTVSGAGNSNITATVIGSPPQSLNAYCSASLPVRVIIPAGTSDTSVSIALTVTPLEQPSVSSTSQILISANSAITLPSISEAAQVDGEEIIRFNVGNANSVTVTSPSGNIQAVTPNETGLCEVGGNKSGTYTITASNAQGYTVITTVIYTAPAPVPATISASASDSDAYGYSAGTLAVAVRASADAGHTLSYQWYSCDSDGQNPVALEGATGECYKLPEGKAVGTYYFYCEVTATRTSSGVSAAAVQSGIVAAEVTLGTLSGVSASGFSGSYDGNGHGITVNAPDGSTVTYSTDKGASYSEESPLFVKAGSYTVYYKVEKASYKPVTGQATVQIAKASFVPSVSLSGWTYGGAPCTPVVEGNVSGGAVTLSYKAATAGDSTYSTTVPTQAGNYVVKVTIAETENYASVQATSTFQIAKAPLTITAADKSMTAGGQLPTFELAYEGFVSGDTAEAVFGETMPAASTTATGADVGEYSIVITAPTVLNYDVKTVPGKLTVHAPYVPPAPVYEIPVSNENTVQVGAELSNGSATVSEITSETISGVVGSPDATSKVETITIDLSGAPEEITSVVLGKTSVETLLQAASQEGNGIGSVTIQLTQASVELDAKTLETLVTQAAGDDIQLVVEGTHQEELNTVQKEALGEHQVATTFEAYFVSGGQRIHDFDGGEAVVSIKFTPEPGKDPSRYCMVYVADDGTLTKHETWYEDGRLCFVTTHFSDYAVIYDAPEPVKAVSKADFGKLKARSTVQTKSSIKIAWNAQGDADGYLVYGAKCGSKNTYKLVKTIKKGSATSWTHKKLKRGTYYKHYVVAYRLVDGEKVAIAKSVSVHATTRGGKYGVAKSVKVTSIGGAKNASKISLSAGKSAVIKAAEVAGTKPIAKHRNLCFESSDESVAKVTASGKVKAVGTGTAKIWVYAQNGVYKTITVTVR